MAKPTDEQIADWYPRLYRTALRMTGCVEEAADLAQQAVLQAMKSWEHFNGRASPSSWVFRILVNCVQDWHRRQARVPGPIPDEFALADAAAPGPSGEASRREELQGLRRAIQTLPADLRAAFVLTVLDGYTYHEAAEMLGVPLGTVAFRVHESRELLKAAMRPFLEV